MTYPQSGPDPTRPQPPVSGVPRLYPPVSAVPGPYPPASGLPGPYPPVSAVPYQPGGYPPAGQRIAVQAPLTSGMATASLVLGILGVLGGWCLFGLPCILAVILGHVALAETRDGRRSGHGMAVAGLVLGYVFVGPMIAFTVMVFFGSVVGAG
ncbi:DUF4190 domain-containing protein [Micromonospora sp. 4G57]|uniref:DUF4190 domain-containing protein n=1 Tax=Micromonospora sicca TaxID=2202420 RepID=A0ABU5J690_9ACTN|nr:MULTISPECIES: DUF4190 domain-containing protein [unclassified Micromonospora]MDZ5443406.1 DUF4190 domain-containing protein [Micromonospora sp. 4G57]MDZ5488094.1 DUF4190 domain-containing protein [Micromonospora sp. 4G53]